MTKNSKQKKFFIGDVISDKMDKTVVVRVQRTFIHPILKKVVKSYKKYKVHDEKQEAKTGDLVKFFEGRPLSKTKYMYLDSIEKKLNEVIS